MTPVKPEPLLIEAELVLCPVEVKRVARLLNTALVAGVCLLLAFGPLAFGMVEEWSMCVLELGTALLIVLWAAREIANGQIEVTLYPVFVPMGLFAGLVVAQLLFRRSAYWYATWSNALLWAAYGMLFFLVTQSFRRRAIAKGFAPFFTVYGFCVALFAIAQQFISNGKIYWVVPNAGLGWVYGPYVNHAHYAGLMEMLVPIPLVFAMAGFSRKAMRGLFLLAVVVMSATVFLSQSLGGMIAFTVELVLLMILSFKGRSRHQMLLVELLCAALVLCLVALSPSGLAERLANLRDPLGKADAANRVVIVKDSLRMVAQHPILGWGLGTFPVVYPAFRSFYSNFLVNEAHDDFVQTLVETGVVGFALMITFIFLLYRDGLRRIEGWRRDPRAALALAALIGCTGLLVHGFSDFNLRVPANAAFFFVLAAVVTCCHGSDRVHQLSGSANLARENKAEPLIR